MSGKKISLAGYPSGEPTNLSRRRFLLASAGTAAGALVIGFGLPIAPARAQAMAPTPIRGTAVPAFLEIRPDSSIRLLSPFIEGGQGTFTAMAQIVGEELDADPSTFIVENAPPGEEFVVMESGERVTGGSRSIRLGYTAMRRLGALARAMLIQAASNELRVPTAELSTEPGKVVHLPTGRSLTYGDLAPRALDLPVPDPAGVKLRDPATFRWIGKPVARLDAYEKSTGKTIYSIDTVVEDMLQAAVKHAPRYGMTVQSLVNEPQVAAMPGVHSVHTLPGAVAVVAERWWNAKKAVEALQVMWSEADGTSGSKDMPADFSSDRHATELAKARGRGDDAEVRGDVERALADAATVVEAQYSCQYVHHAQLEPPSTIARFNPDGTLEVWAPNQAQDMFKAAIAKASGVAPDKVVLHSPMIGGFFGRHFLYPAACPFPQAIELAKATGRPIKVIWSREEEFLRDPLRPMASVRFRGGLDSDGLPVALEAITATEGATEGINDKRGKEIDDTAVEGLAGKLYNVPDRRIAHLYVRGPVMLGYWRSVGSSMNDFFYECFLDEMTDRGHSDPVDVRRQLLKDNPRLLRVLNEAVDLSGGWKRGPFKAADGTLRARGVAMASPFGSHAAAVAEVSIERGLVRVHDIWEAIDPGSIVNPAIVEAQVRGAVALGVSMVLMEEAVYKDGAPTARNYDLYPILPPNRMPNVHVRVIESGEPMGGIGEPPLPAVPPAIANAVSHLTGTRIRSMPLSKYDFT